MEQLVIVRLDGSGRFLAQAVTVPEVKATADTAADAVEQVRQSLSRERLVMALSIAFGALALALACIGLYGILAYAVTRRTNEIGIRMALGATQGKMVWLILREAMALAASGIVIGVPAVLALERIARALLYGVGPFDIPAFGCALMVLLACAALAGIVPARRAGRLDPMSALRCE